MHTLQKVLLKRLQIQNNQRYGTLASGYDFEDNIVFHLKKLLFNKYIDKNNGVYSITLKGIKEISKYEPFKLEERGVKTFFIGFLCHDKSKNYLIKSHQNAKENFYNLPSIKPFFGENIEDSLVRGFELNTGIKLAINNFKFTSLHLKTVQSSEGEVIFDDAFTIYSVNLENVEISKMKLMNSLSWKSVEEIKSLDNKWPELDICIINQDFSTYKNYTVVSDYIL